MDLKYKITGTWDMENSREFYGMKFQRFLADFPSIQDSKKITTLSIYIPFKYVKNAVPEQLVEIELTPGTYIVQLVPFTMAIGDTTGLSRTPIIYAEDLEVEHSTIRAIPASRALPAS